MTSDTERRNALLVSECLLRCCTTALQGCDGSILEVCEEKISCQSGTASIMALQCWKRKVLRLGKVSLPRWKGRGSTGLLHTVVCVHACAAQARNVFLSFTLPAVAPANSSLCFPHHYQPYAFPHRWVQIQLYFFFFGIFPSITGWKQLRLIKVSSLCRKIKEFVIGLLSVMLELTSTDACVTWTR